MQQKGNLMDSDKDNFFPHERRVSAGPQAGSALSTSTASTAASSSGFHMHQYRDAYDKY